MKSIKQSTAQEIALKILESKKFHQDEVYLHHRKKHSVKLKQQRGRCYIFINHSQSTKCYGLNWDEALLKLQILVNQQNQSPEEQAQ